HIIVNPDWTVPPKLARQDILPKVRENPSYLAEHNFTVFSGWSAEARRLDPASIDWSGIGGKSFPYKLVQAPGPNNALGRIKFMLPNRYNVYLHDTPSRELFDRTTRAFSSGCVRLAKPLELADHLLRDQPDWDPSRLRAAIDSGRTMRINLPVSIPVYFTYFTAWVDDDGTVQFRDDVYDRDASLYAALRDQLIIQTSPPVRPGQ
ncbi:MAG TPA: L,D-transpeptidase family protein, partial [Kiloniellales bacterium]|nr:L,D-transpeptidase family protein [Kiloniellales bacterium]